VSGRELALKIPNEGKMMALGGEFARAMVPGMIIYLNGDLGMGKTTFARGFIRALGHSGAVKSPTFTLVEPYEFPEVTVYHFDLYRLGDPEELEYIGMRDYFECGSVCLIEWSERGRGFLPPADLVINIERKGQGRMVKLLALSTLGKGLIESVSESPSQLFMHRE